MENLLAKWSYNIKEGDRIVKRQRPKLSKSFVVAFGKLLYMLMSGNSISMQDTSNVTRTGYVYNNINIAATSGNTYYGIIVGSSNAAESINDYNLGTQIAHGAGAGQIQYGANTTGSPTATSTTASFRITRVFTNTSGGNVTIEEIGLAFSSGYYFLIIRDITGTITLTNGQAITINYDLTTTI